MLSGPIVHRDVFRAMPPPNFSSVTRGDRRRSHGACMPLRARRARRRRQEGRDGLHSQVGLAGRDGARAVRSSGSPAVTATASACCQLHPTLARACLHRECYIEGEGGSKKRGARPHPAASARCLTHAHQQQHHRCHVHPSATRHATHARSRHRRCGQGREQGLQVDEGHAVALEQLARRHLPR